ncbi:MAG TPA: hypothetical protein VGS41_00240 [Chthonomonadales bacterium]|nr:hypothetical protein [Chthonomonadales bacterium]
MPRLLAMVQSSGGDWRKVSQADKAYLIRTAGHGNQRLATMAFNRQATAQRIMLRWLKRVDIMAAGSGGNWNRLAEKDQSYIVNMVCKGDAAQAHRLFADRAALLKTRPAHPTVHTAAAASSRR